jgi:hypothetical protein
MNTTHKTWLLLLGSLSLAAPGCVGEGDDESTARQEAAPETCADGLVWYVDACVPGECHGRTRRSADLKTCAPDPSKPEVSLDVTAFRAPTPVDQFQPQLPANQQTLERRNLLTGSGIGTLYPATRYQWSFDVAVRLADALAVDEQFSPAPPPDPDASHEEQFDRTSELSPKKLGFKVWIEDTYSYDSKTYKAFRCVATGFEISPSEDRYSGSRTPDTRIYRVDFEDGISRDCETEGPALSRQNAAREAGVSVETFASASRYVASNLRVSFDIDGDAVWHKTATTLDEVVNGEPECEPRPLELLYDATSKTTRYREYYAQRQLGGTVPVFIPSANVGRRAQIGPQSVRARQDLTVRPYSRFNQPLIVDYEFFTSNLNATHLLNPFDPRARSNPSKRVEAGGLWRGGTIDEKNFAPRNLRAEFFLVPEGAQVGSGAYLTAANMAPYKLGQRALSKPDDNTVISDTYSFPITQTTMNRFLDPDSASFIPGDQRAFTLAYCITSTDYPFSAFTYLDSPLDTPSASSRFLFWNSYEIRDQPNPYGSTLNSVPNTPEWWDELVFDDSRSGLFRRDQDALVDRLQGASNFDPGIYMPFLRGGRGNFNAYRYGCRRDPRPVIVTVDRFVTATEPVLATAYQGSLDADETGDSSASGGNDNLHDIQCERVNPEDPNDRRLDDSDCDEMVQIGGRSDGADSRTLYSVQSNVTRQQNDADRTAVGAGVRGEFMGFQLIDQEDDDSNPFETGVQDAMDSTVSLSIEPPWDKIVNILSKYNTEGQIRTEWTKGAGVSQNGIGYSLGFKIPFKIGPVPVVVIISFNIGANLSVDLEFKFKPDDGDQYPCVGESDDCVTLAESPATFAAASKACIDSGGKLLELATRADYERLINLQDASGDPVTLPEQIWVGGQTAYRVADAACIGNGSSVCKQDQTTELRWLTGGVLARARGRVDLATPSGVTPVEGLDLSLGGDHFPTQKGVVFSNNALSLANLNEQKSYLCQYDKADSESYFSAKVETPVTIATGVGVAGCVPAPSETFCLGGEVTFVEFKLTPSYSTTTYNLFRTVDGARQTSKRSTTVLSATFAITLFAAEFAATIDIWIATIKWVIAQYSGVTAIEQTLYEDRIPSIGGWE